MKYFWACVALGIMVLLTPPLTAMWESYAPGIIGETNLTVFEQAVIDYAFPYGFVVVCLIVVFIGLRGRRKKEE